MINLLPHNEELFNKILDAMFNGYRKIFYSEATGLGKSYIFMKLVEELFTGKRILYVVPKVAIWSNLTAYSEFKTLNAEITMTTFSSFNTVRNDYKDWDCVFVDECHHMLSDIQGTNVNKFLDSVIKNGGYAFGLTATPKYHGLFVDECFFPVSCYGLDIFEAIEQELLPKIKLAVADINLDEVPQDLRAKYSVTGSKSVLDRVIEDNSTITHWLAYFYTVEDLENAEYELSLLFPDYKIFKVHSELENNVKTVNDFSEYKGKAIMLSVSMLLEGLHVRNVGGVLLYRNVVTVSTYMQIYGRLCTLNMKDTPIFVDITNSIFQLQDLEVFKSKRTGVLHKRNIRDIFDVTANSYWTVELYDYLQSLVLHRKPWTEDEDLIIVNNSNLSDKELADLLRNRTFRAVRKRRCELGLKHLPGSNALWTDEELQILHDNSDKKIPDILHLLPGRTAKAIQAKKDKLDLNNVRGERCLWEDWEIQIVKENLGKLTYNQISQLLPNRSRNAVQQLVAKKLSDLV